MSQDSVIHKGIVTSLNEKSVEVNIISQSACSSCHAKGSCSAADVQDKYITVDGDFSSYKNGETVNVIMAKHQGFIAAIWAYIAPLVVLVVALVVLLQFFPEGIAGILSLGVVALYYVVLFLGRKIFFNSFSFKIEKI